MQVIGFSENNKRNDKGFMLNDLQHICILDKMLLHVQFVF